MEISEILELLDRRGWTKTDLASELDLTESAVWYWFRAHKPLRGPAARLMRIWLDESRGTISIVTNPEANPPDKPRTNGHPKRKAV